jgi:two-component system sensor histidine kinase UhpB
LPEGFRFGFGFLGMSERVRKLGGQLKIANGVNKGTLIEALIPVSQRAAEPPSSQRLENILAKG